MPENPLTTEPSTAVVVGASRGIGLAITKALLGQAQIKRVFASYRQPVSATELLALTDERL